MPCSVIFIIYRATSASSGYTDDGFDDYADPDEPDQEGAALSLTPQLSPKSSNEDGPKQIYGRAPIQNPDTDMRYSTDQHRSDVQRLSDDAEKERRSIEDKLFQFRESDVIRRKLKEQEENLNSRNQNRNFSQNLNYNQNNYSNPHQYPQQQQQQQQQHQHLYPNNYHNNYLNNYENNFQIMEQHNEPSRQPQPQLQLQQQITNTSSSSKSNNSNNHNHPSPYPHERYVGMLKSDSRSNKTKKLKSVVEVTRKIIKKSKFNYVLHDIFLMF